MPLDISITAGRHPLTDRKQDLYQTPACATRALLANERITHTPIWEPACGRGAIVQVLQTAGYSVIGTDLLSYGEPRPPIDFLFEHLPFIGTIITNPPYSLADQFVRHALKICPRVMMLLRLAFLEGQGRSDILDNAGLIRVNVFRKRLPMMHREGWTGPKSSSATAFAWFVWDREQRGKPTEMRRISWT